MSAVGLAAALLASPAFGQGWPSPVAPLPERATALDKRFQPAVDFDTDVCFNVPAVDASGAISPAASTYATRPPASCRAANYRTQSNVYARSRCNNGYCGRVYSYFWQSDFSHAFDWESIIVWTTDQGTSSRVVGVTRGDHGDWDTRPTSGGQLRFVSDASGEHVKLVFHYETWGFSHLWRFSKTDGGDEPAENGTGQWLIQPLVSWNGYPSVAVRNAVSNYDFKGANFDNKEARFASMLAAANAGGIAPGFNANVDAGSNSPGCRRARRSVDPAPPRAANGDAGRHRRPHATAPRPSFTVVRLDRGGDHGRAVRCDRRRLAPAGARRRSDRDRRRAGPDHPRRQDPAITRGEADHGRTGRRERRGRASSHRLPAAVRRHDHLPRRSLHAERDDPPGDRAGRSRPAAGDAAGGASPRRSLPTDTGWRCRSRWTRSPTTCSASAHR
ncbi:hypothetical protein NI18_20290 [Sphingomonas sp. Ant20]|nr:hypothetical protein NI18_20290 [Sphingomonas sp. Ant20]